MKKIVGIGACVMDTLITLPHYPKEDTKLKAVSVKSAGGGPVATGLVAAQKLGCDTGFIGTLSDDNGGTFLLADFEKYGVDISDITVQKGFRSFTATLFLSQETATRTCVFDRGNLPALVLSQDQQEAIQKAFLLMVDGNELEAAVAGAAIARENGTKVLYDAGGLYEGVERLLPLADYLIPSEEFALGHTGCETAEEAARKLYDTYHPEIVVITQGKEGGLLYDGKDMKRYPVFMVNAVDTNGSGDVFHGAFAAALVKGYAPLKCCYFSSAVSALKCTGVGARESVPDFETVKVFLKENGYEL